MPLIILDIGAVVVAAALALLYWAAQQLFGPLLNGLANNVSVWALLLAPVVAPTIAWIQSSTSSWVDSGVSPLIGAVGAPWDKLDHLFSQVEVVFGAVVAAIRALPTNIIAQVEQAVVAPVQQEVSQFEAWTRDQVAALDSTITADVRAVVAGVDQAVAGVEATVAQDVQAVTADVDQAVTQLGGTVTSEIQEVRAGVTQDISAVNTSLQEDIAGVKTLVAQLAGQLAGDVDQGVSTAENYADGLVRQLSRVVAGVSAAVAVVTATAAATAARVATDEEECITPLCSAFRSTADAARGIQALIADGVLLAAVAEAMHDPAGAAKLAQDIVTPMAGQWSDFVRAL